MDRMVSTIVCSYTHNAICIDNDGNVFSFQDEIGEEKLLPTVIPSLKNIKSIALGDDLSVCLDYDGNVFTFGDNRKGQLGIGVDRNSLSHASTPQKVNLPFCKQVSCGFRFIICLSDDDTLYSFGHNNYGQLGLEDTLDYNSPQKIPSLQDIEFIECGAYHSFCKTFDNRIYSWGYDAFGQLGYSKSKNRPTLCSSLSDEIVKDIKCGLYHTLALTSNQEVFSCGSNSCGSLGTKSQNDFSTSFRKIPFISEITRRESNIRKNIK